MQAMFLYLKQIEKSVESGGQDGPVLDFEQRTERRIYEGKRSAVVNCYFANGAFPEEETRGCDQYK